MNLFHCQLSEKVLLDVLKDQWCKQRYRIKNVINFNKKVIAGPQALQETTYDHMLRAHASETTIPFCIKIDVACGGETNRSPLKKLNAYLKETSQVESKKTLCERIFGKRNYLILYK